MSETLTAFDAVAITVILISALMALARGFMRELATLGAFIAAIAAAYYGHMAFRGRVAAMLGDSGPDWMPDLIVVLVFFLAAYILVAWLGARLSRNIQGLEGVGPLDRLAGVAFGAARGGVAVVFFVLLLNLALPEDDTPDWIQEARTFPVFHRAAAYVQANAPRIAADVRTALPERSETLDAEGEPG